MHATLNEAVKQLIIASEPIFSFTTLLAFIWVLNFSAGEDFPGSNWKILKKGYKNEAESCPAE